MKQINRKYAVFQAGTKPQVPFYPYDRTFNYRNN